MEHFESFSQKDEAQNSGPIMPLGPHDLEKLKDPGKLAETADAKKINIKEIADTAEAILQVMAGKYTGEKVIPMLAIIAMKTTTSYLAMVIGVDSMVEGILPENLEMLGSELKGTSVYEKRVAPVKKNIIGSLSRNNDRINKLREKIIKIKPGGPPG